MGSSFAGFVLDPSKCSKLTMDEKRELVHEISKWSEGAPEMLQSWSRRELLEILCAEMGKERKYTGLTKIRMIELLLKIVSKKNLTNRVDGADSARHTPPSNNQTSSKRQRKTDHPVRVIIPANDYPNGSQNFNHVIYCQNLACRASLQSNDAFCKRCSCCICHKYDDNKDPSLWLVCSSERPNEVESCGLSCHLECALKNERTGIIKGGPYPRLDGSFYCAYCTKVNDLLGCWRKQLMFAKDARRVDTLCYRIFLGLKLLNGTEKFQSLHEIVNNAAKKLEAEVGCLDGLPVKMGRSIVNRLSCGAEIQKLCASAVEMLDSLLSTHSEPCPGLKAKDAILISQSNFCFEDVSPTSLTLIANLDEDAVSEELLGYTLWHRKAVIEEYPTEPTCTLFKPNNCFFLTGLTPSTDYIFKVIAFGNSGDLEQWEAKTTTADEQKILSNPSSDGDESNDTGHEDLNNSRHSTSKYKSQVNLENLNNYARKDIKNSSDISESSDQEEMPSDSISALDEEVVTRVTGSTPSSTIQTESQRDSTYSSDENHTCDVPLPKNKNNLESQVLEEMSIDNESKANAAVTTLQGRSESVLPVTPCKQQNGKDGSTRNAEDWSRKPEKEPQAGSSSKKRSAGRFQETCMRDGSLERDYEYCVKVIRWLECEGHMERNFRVKFLTWFSLWATPQERRIVSVYVDTLIDDPASLAGQLVDTFSEGIGSKRPPPAPTGFCMKLWH